MTTDIIEMVERLNAQTTAVEAEIWLPLLRLLAQGRPVAIAELAAAAGKSETQVREILEAVPDTEYDADGRIIGRGLTLRPTPYKFQIGGRQLYTWCALDTLIFPAVLGTAARIESSCHATSVPVLVHIEAAGVVKARPASTVVSLINPDDIRSVRSAFCNQVHFFASAQAALPWLERHPDCSVIPLDEAGRLGTLMAEALLDETQSKSPGAPRGGVQDCGC